MGAASEEAAPIAGYYNTESNVCSIPTRQIQVYEEVFLLNLQVKYSQIC